MKRKLVDDWNKAWKWASVRFMAIAAAIQGAWMFIPEDMRNSIPHDMLQQITVALLILGLIGRITTSKDI